MIPFILTIVGGYLIGDSMKESKSVYADGGEIRKIKGVNFSAQIENSRKFKELIQKVYDNQSGDKHPIEFITAIAKGKEPIVKHEGKNYVKGYSYKGTISHFEFLDDSNFVKALEYVDRPAIRKFEDGGSIEEGNNRMLMSNIKEVKHHADELDKIVTPKTEVEAWVVAKAERSASDLSDITHYLDSNKK